MKKVIIFGAIVVVAVLAIILIPKKAKTDAKVTIYVFRGATCEHCEAALDYISKNEDSIPEGVEIVTYEVWKNSSNEALHQALVKKLGVSDSNKNSVPLFVIGNDFIVGMSPNKADFDEILDKAQEYLNGTKKYKDEVKESVNELKKEDPDYKFSAVSFDVLYANNKFAMTIVLGIFGLLIIGFLGMILFSKQK